MSICETVLNKPLNNDNCTVFNLLHLSEKALDGIEEKISDKFLGGFVEFDENKGLSVTKEIGIHALKGQEDALKIAGNMFVRSKDKSLDSIVNLLSSRGFSVHEYAVIRRILSGDYREQQIMFFKHGATVGEILPELKSDEELHCFLSGMLSEPVRLRKVPRPK